MRAAARAESRGRTSDNIRSEESFQNGQVSFVRSSDKDLQKPPLLA